MSSDVPAGPEVAPTLQVVASLTLTGTPQSNSSNPSISPASSAMIVIFVSLFILATLGMFGSVHSTENRIYARCMAKWLLPAGYGDGGQHRACMMNGRWKRKQYATLRL
ncbi:hypothetical protein J3R82DRAFT_5953 [Butyriboletus roseoflavus]|nr:hypothetical protein J3R82DRAFT_5953 [Butyriboletus roseoflavus]